MLVLGNYRCIPNNKFIVYNFTSFIMGYKQLYLFPPYTNINMDFDFDMQYASIIMNDQEMFLNFMEIIVHLYMLDDIYLIIDIDDIDLITLPESLLKIIQQRYGYDGFIINEPEDWEFVKESTFTKEGLQVFYNDRLQYIALRQLGGTLNVNEFI